MVLVSCFFVVSAVFSCVAGGVVCFITGSSFLTTFSVFSVLFSTLSTFSVFTVTFGSSKRSEIDGNFEELVVVLSTLETISKRHRQKRITAKHKTKAL